MSLLTAPASEAASFSYRNHTNGNYSIEATGAIEPGDAKKLRALVASDYVRYLNTTGVSFESDGGNVQEAMALGDELRKLGLNSSVAANQVCASACVLAWSGADFRSRSGSSRIILHRPFLPPADVTQFNYGAASSVTSESISQVRTYLVDRNIPVAFIEKMMSLASNEGYELNREDLVEYPLMSPVLEEQALAKCHVTNHTILSSPDVRESVLCVGDLLKDLRRAHLFAELGPDRAIKILAEVVARAVVQERASKGNSQSFAPAFPPASGGNHANERLVPQGPP